MKNFGERDFTTYPRRFLAYRWYKPLLLAAFFVKDRPLSSYFSSYCSSHSFSMPEPDLTNMNGDTIR